MLPAGPVVTFVPEMAARLAGAGCGSLTFVVLPAEVCGSCSAVGTAVAL
jgi:hypothetical protein